MNKLISKIIGEAWESHALAGNWKKAEFSKGEHGTSFMLYERMDYEKAYFYAVNEFLKLNGIPEGIYTKKRAQSLLDKVSAFINQPVLGPADLKVGNTLKLGALHEISAKYRQGDVGSLDMMVERNIVDLVNCLEENGYQDTYGSCYTNEIVLVKQADGSWRVFEGIETAPLD